MSFDPHQKSLLYLRGLITLGFAYYNWRSYSEARKIVKRPWAFLIYFIWALFEVVTRLIVVFVPTIFSFNSFLDNHWFEFAVTSTVILQLWGSREIYKIISVEDKDVLKG